MNKDRASENAFQKCGLIIYKSQISNLNIQRKV